MSWVEVDRITAEITRAHGETPGFLAWEYCREHRNLNRGMFVIGRPPYVTKQGEHVIQYVLGQMDWALDQMVLARYKGKG